MVQCRNCGLVGQQSEKSGGSIELGTQFRESGEIPPRDFFEHHEVLCFAQKIKFSVNPGPRKNELAEERQCQSFIAWQPGFSPKGHIEMDLIERQRMREDQRDRRQEIWQEKQATRSFRINLFMLGIAIIAAIAAWWGALHPSVVVIPQTKSQTQTNADGK